jgi:F0F1-type ATP synthase assembly protein I
LTARRARAIWRCFFRAGGDLPEKRPSEGREEDAAESYRRAAPYLDASWQLVGSVALWTAAGWFADRKLHTVPWLLVSGAVVGTALGFYLFFKSVLAIGRKK